MPRAKKNESPYSVHPSVYMVIKWVTEMKEKTGRTLEEWLAYIAKNAPKTVRERSAWLKEKHGFGSNTASWLAERADRQATWEESEEAYLTIAPKYVEEMFAGKKAPMLPLYHKLLELGQTLGDDVKFCPCKTMVPFYRKHVIAQIKPTTNTRVDFGLALGDTKASGKLIDTGGFQKKDRITHRFAIEKLADINAEVKKWLQIAYERDE